VPVVLAADKDLLAVPPEDKPVQVALEVFHLQEVSLAVKAVLVALVKQEEPVGQEEQEELPVLVVHQRRLNLAQRELLEGRKLQHVNAPFAWTTAPAELTSTTI